MSEQIPILGFIGLGVMGGPMCRNVATRHAAPVHVFDASDEARRALAPAGVVEAPSIAAVAAAAEVVFLSLPGGAQVREVCLGPDGLAAHARPGLVVVDLSTTSVAEAREIGAALAERGVTFADAPVARTREAARQGTLSIMVGAEPDLFARLEPLLRYMGSDVTRCGGLGCGQVVKLINNTLLFAHVAALAELMVVGERSGVEAETLIKAVSLGSGDSFALRNHGLKAMAPRAFPERAFPSTYVLKDMGYAIDLARSCGVEPRMPEQAARYYRAAVDEGLGDRYFPVIIELVDQP